MKISTFCCETVHNVIDNNFSHTLEISNSRKRIQIFEKNKMEELLSKVKALEVKSMRDLDLDLVKQASDNLKSIYAELEQMKGNVVTIQIGSYIR